MIYELITKKILLKMRKIQKFFYLNQINLKK